MSENRLMIEKLQNGYVVSKYSGYSDFTDKEICCTFEDAIMRVAERIGERAFASTLVQSQAFAKALVEVCEIAVKPKFQAIEARINPGSENITDDISF